MIRVSGDYGNSLCQSLSCYQNQLGKGKTRQRKNGNGKAKKRVKGGKAEKRVKGGKICYSNFTISSLQQCIFCTIYNTRLLILAMHWEKNLLKKRTVLTEYLIYVYQRFVFF